MRWIPVSTMLVDPERKLGCGSEDDDAVGGPGSDEPTRIQLSPEQILQKS